MKRASLIGICLAVVLVLASPAGAQVTYKPIDLGTLGGSFSGASSANGIDGPARVVGISTTVGNAAFNAFLWTKQAGMKDLGTLGGTNSFAQGINDNGEIVGQADTTASSHAFMSKGTAGPQDLGTLGGSLSQANAINFDDLTQAASQIAGWSLVTGDTAFHAVTWDASSNMTDLGTLGGTNSFAFGNNCIKQVVGSSGTPGDATTDAFVWDPVNGMKDLGTLGGSTAQATAINCNGQIVGSSSLAGDLQTDAFLFANGAFKDLGTLGGSFSQANAINDPGRVVGFSNTAGDADVHAFLWTPKGGMQDLNNLIPANSGWDLNAANSIDSRGFIVGNGTLNGQFHAFLLVPVTP